MTVFALKCITPAVINLVSHLPMTEQDLHQIQVSKIRCGQIYPDAPYLTRFYKVAERQYRAVCGSTEK